MQQCESGLLNVGIFRYRWRDCIDLCDEQNACSAAKHSNGSHPALADESAHQRSALGHLQCARVPPERNTLPALTRVLTKVLGQAWRTAGLEMLDQLRLSLELIRTGQQMLPSTRTVAPARTSALCHASSSVRTFTPDARH